MAKRRPAGDGMVRKRSDGRWEGRIVVGHKENGDPIFRYVFADTQKELLPKLQQSIDAYRGVELTEDSSMTLADWLDRWLERMSVKVRPSTLENYRGLAERHLKPHLGGKPLSRITDADAQKLYDTVKHHGRLKEHPVYGYSMSDSVVHSVHALLYSALKAAVEAHLLAKNPLADLLAPKPNHKPMKVLNKVQLEVFMEVIKTDEVWHDFFYTEMTTGLRRGELCGLMWTDFDADAGTLTVDRTLHTDGSVGDTKTYAGARTITLPAGTAALLRKRQTSALSQWIFHHPLKPEQPVNASSAYNRLKALLKKGGLPDIRFHDLRHTFATHALANGVDAKTLAAILGHTNASFTLDTYTHVTGDMQKNAADKIGDYITEMFGGETRLWQNGESVATAASA